MAVTRWPQLAAAGTAVALILLALPSLVEPHWYGDEGQFAAIAHDIRAGQGLYSDAWDIKPPFIFWTYAAVQSVAGTGMFPLHFTGLLVLLATQASAMASARFLVDWQRAWIAGATVALFAGLPYLEGNLALTEKFLILPTSLAALLVILAGRRDWRVPASHYLAAGLLIGLAMNFKQVAGWDGAAFALFIACAHPAPFRPLVALAVGVIVPHALVVSWFASQGAFAEYWAAVAGELPAYSRLAPDHGVLHAAGRFVPAIAAAGWLGRARYRGVRPPLFVLPFVWLAFACAGATSSTFGFPHYLLQAVPAFALAMATAPALPLSRIGPRRVGAVSALGVVLVAVIYVQFAQTFRDYAHNDLRGYYTNGWERITGQTDAADFGQHLNGRSVAMEEIADLIRADGRSEPTLVLWSEMVWVYPLSGAHNPTRYYTTFLSENIDGAKDELTRAIEGDPPDYVLFSDDANGRFEALEELTGREYEPLAEGGGWQLYRRKG